MSDQFKMNDSHRKSFITAIVIGVVLLLVGILYTEFAPTGGHGDGHHDTEAVAEHGGGTDHAEEAHGEHAAPAHDDHGDAHADAATGEGHAAEPEEIEMLRDLHHGEDVPNLPAVDELGEQETEGIGAMTENTVRVEFYNEQGAMPVPHHSAPTLLSKLGAAWLMGSYFWIAVAVFGIFFMAVGYVANAGWYIAFKRIVETYYRFLVIGGGMMIVVVILLPQVYSHWAGEGIMDKASPHYDPLVAGKGSFLNYGFFIASIILVLVWAFFGHRLRGLSLSEEKEGGTTYYKKSIATSALFLPIFAISFCLIAFLWLMSLEPHWFSTIYAVYCFAGMFVSGTVVTMIISSDLKANNYLPQLTGDHLHDLGKFMFAFSIFWAYIWVSQFLLIWYANIPEETIYYTFRFDHYLILFFVNLVINFFFPFLALMTRDAKRKARSIRTVGFIMLFGRALDLFLLIMPGAVGANWDLGILLMGLGMIVAVGGVFFMTVYTGLEKAPLVAKNHPYFEESLHHSTGV